MTKASVFIKEELVKQSEALSSYNVRYAYDKDSSMHVIEISPKDKFNEQEELIDWQLDFWGKFERCFEGESLVISEPSCIHDMSNLLYENECKMEAKVKRIEMFFTEGSGAEPIPYVVPYISTEWSQGTFSSSSEYNANDTKSQTIQDIDYKYK